MDQIRVALAWLKQHHFWVLLVIALGTVVGVWYSGSSAVAAQFKKQKSAIDSEFNSVRTHRSKQFKVNDRINQTQQQQIDVMAAAVLEEWKKLYSRQKEEVLIWPEELGDDFVSSVADLTFGDSINSRRREIYQNYIKGTFESLVEVIDARPLAESAGGLRGSPGRGGPGLGGLGMNEGGGLGRPPGLGGAAGDGGPVETYLTEWLDQAEVRDRLDLEKKPSSVQIWVLQEDLWVYRTLLQAIASTNEATGATRRARAAVQTVTELKVGQEAAGDDPKGDRLAAPDAIEAPVGGGGFGGGGFGGGFEGGRGFGGGGGGFGPPGGGRGGFGGGGLGGGRGGFGGFEGGPGGGASGDDAATVLLTGRYLDDTGQPDTNVPPDYQFGREFKRLPVRMVLEMDTAWLSHLMMELANAPLQVEIDQVRFNPEGMTVAGRRPGQGEVAAFDRKPTVGTVVMQGIVYIFNQPDDAIGQAETF